MSQEHLANATFTSLQSMLGDSFDEFVASINATGQSCIAKINDYNASLSTPEEVSSAAHKLKSSAGYLGATKIVNVLEAIELAVKESDEQALLKLTALAPDLWETLMQELNSKSNP